MEHALYVRGNEYSNVYVCRSAKKISQDLYYLNKDNGHTYKSLAKELMIL